MDVDPRFTRRDKSRNRLLAHLLSLALALLPCLATARADGLPPPGTALQSRAIQVGDTTWAYYEGEKKTARACCSSMGLLPARTFGPASPQTSAQTFT